MKPKLLLAGLGLVMVLALYVLNAFPQDRSTSIVRAADGPSVIATIATGWAEYRACDVAVDPATNRLYVANYYSNDVAVIDGATNEVDDDYSFPGYLSRQVNIRSDRI